MALLLFETNEIRMTADLQCLFLFFSLYLLCRKAEEEHLAAFGREQGEGAQWDEIARLCEAKAQQKGGKDVSRLKSLLLHLKDHQPK